MAALPPVRTRIEDRAPGKRGQRAGAPATREALQRGGYALAALLTLALTVVACGPAPIPLISSSMTPAASGQITTDEGKNGNLELHIEVKHLAPPAKIRAGAKVFVVWVERPGAAPQNVGALEVDEDLSGKLDTVTPLHRFDVAITAEDDPAAASPRGPRVLFASVER